MRFLIIMAVALFGASEAWDNVLQKDLYFTCPTHQAIWKVHSQHLNEPEDRYFDFYCRDFPSYFDFCTWTGFINLYQSPGLFSCGDNMVIVGAHSIFSGSSDDRQWRFFCCGSNDYRVINMYQADKHMTTSDPVNTHSVDSNHWYYGLFTKFDTYHRDRTWQFEVASLHKM